MGKPLIDDKAIKQTGPVECLGLTFPNDEERRKYFTEKLREHLKNPEFRKIEGFPIGTDEDILKLSDPPYYTACPNPFIEDFIKCYGKPYNPETDNYRREPFAADVSEGKNDPIYNAHSYHTKVPHKAIMRYILHYTEPGDIVFDGFCGTGMTGVAAQLCGDKKVVESLGYKVLDDGTILDEEGKPFSRLGARRAVLNDLSPAATFIAYNYNTPVDVSEFEREAKSILKEVEDECGWMYQTFHIDDKPCNLLKISVELASSQLKYDKSRQDAGYTNGITDFTIRKDNLPHWQKPGAHYFITFKTNNRRTLSESARDIVMDALRFWHGKRLNLIQAVVMPDHIHAIIFPCEKFDGTYWDLSELMHSIKSYSAHEINKAEGAVGTTVWQSETYDHIIRDEREYHLFMSYIAYNPVKKGLVEDIMDYRWHYLCEDMKKAGWKPAPRGIINYTVWSDVFICPECTGEVIFWNVAVDKEEGTVRDEFPCPHCNVKLTKRTMERAWITKFDKAINQTIKQAKQLPVLINYSVELASGQPVNQLNFNHSSRQDAGSTAKMKRFEKVPDVFDLALIEKIENSDIPHWFPTYRMPEGDESRRNDYIGITHVHHFYTKRNLWVLEAIYQKTSLRDKLIAQSIVATLCSRLVRYNMGNRGNGPLSGTLYVSSLNAETNPLWVFPGKADDFSKAFIVKTASYVETESLTDINMDNDCLDYVFTDPPFGGNLMYSELNFLWEAWLKVYTNNNTEAIENEVQGKGLLEYQALMTRCFAEYYRLLKPGRWMTVEFHNSKNSVWNAIQESLQHAGFVIADVRTLDKQQKTFKQVTSSGAVKQDLIISAYKPNGGLEERFKLKAGTEEGVWDFVRTHLRQLPVFVQSKDGRAEVIAERMNYLLFDRMVAFHVQRGMMIPISAAEFYAGLEQRFPSRDGMYFLSEQAAEYDKKRMTVKEFRQLQLFVTDEASAIQWLKQQLTRKPQTFQEIHPQFMKEIGGWQKYEKPLELLEMLEQNFLRYDGKDDVPSQIHSYLSTNFKELRNLSKDDPSLRDKAKDRWYVPDPNKAHDLEKLRERALLKDFEEYKSFTGRKLKSFRIEAVRAGFKRAWQERDYQTIISVAKRIPENVLQEDPKLLMWYDQAITRTGMD